MKRYKKHISRAETSGVIILGVVFVTAAVSQLLYGSDLALLLTILAICGLLFAFLLLTPSAYDFEETELVLVNPKPLKDKRIRYTEVIYIDTVGTFRHTKKDFDSVEVILTCRSASGWKRTVSCHPKNVTDFVKTLHKCCPNLILDEE